MFRQLPTYAAIAVFAIVSAFASDMSDAEKDQALIVEADSELAASKCCEKPIKCAPAPKCKPKCKPKCEPQKCKPKCEPQKCEPICDPILLFPSLPCPDAWRVSGDFLYWLPTLDDTYFVLDSGITTTFPNGERKNNDFGFKPGFRVGAEYASCDNGRELKATYSHLSANEKRTISGSHLWATLGRPDVTSSFEDYAGSASSSLHLLYQNADLNFTQEILNRCGVFVSIQPGIEYAYFRLSESYDYETDGDTSGIISLKSRGWGVGPQIGLGVDYNLYQGALTCSSMQAFAISSLFSGSILMGHGKTQNFQSLVTLTSLQVHDEHTWKTIPAFHAKLGLDYLISASNFGVSVGVGYEFNTYVRALARSLFSDDVADAMCSTNYYNFDLQGLYVSGAISF